MILFLLFAAAASAAVAQTPDCSLVPGWTQQGKARLYEGENLYEYINGNSEGYLIYGFTRMKGVSCTKGGDTVIVDVSEFPDAESAYGMFCANRDLEKPADPLGMGGQITPRKSFFAKGNYYIEVAAEPEKDHTATVKEWAQALDKKIAGETGIPEPIGWFPKEGLTSGSARLVPQSVLGFRILKRGYVAQYGKTKAFVITEVSVEEASGTMDKLRARFGEFQKVAAGDDAIQTTDRYLGRLCVIRKGKRLTGYASVPEGQDPVALSKALAARLP